MALFRSVAGTAWRRPGAGRTFSGAALLLPMLVLVLLLTGCASGAGIGFGEAARSGGGGESSAPPTELITENLIANERQANAAAARQDLSPLFVQHPPPYTIGRGDILSIVVWDHPELAAGGMTMATSAADAGVVQPNVTPPGFAVDHQGRIQFPLAGLLPVEGLTEEQARALLTKKLARYIANPNLTLRVQAYRSRRVYVDGEVRLPGLQAIDDIPMTLVEAINRAGGMQPTADQSRIVVERGDARYTVNMRELVQKGVNPGTILLAHGDVVRVHSRDESKVFVSGEVITPRALTMHNGRLTLNEALGETGGISPLSGDARQVYVVRKTAERTRVFRLDARDSGALAMAETFELRPKDVVYVAASPLANWNRNLSLIFPGALTNAVGVTNRP
ncbi:polysaccharide biosynthesis/export family protein [Massilia sp. YIM B02443]|uniref:polysaccharide biosynthesis/export family protein n=1 Tax=Massilia sp. YIM B02443 TaxID=3050127 RepID=UPI0025B67775|nr:polysaccharide biosynthesis/export family protein [Massilia sp. YIM B02443]MDN4039546.1 polysaccharide biosynthesis/export family protein [Massilia sp. YIM B02443]